jgi:hypothetical protein
METKAITFLNESKRYKNMSVKDKKELVEFESEGSRSLCKELFRRIS